MHPKSSDICSHNYTRGARLIEIISTNVIYKPISYLIKNFLRNLKHVLNHNSITTIDLAVFNVLIEVVGIW